MTESSDNVEPSAPLIGGSSSSTDTPFDLPSKDSGSMSDNSTHSKFAMFKSPRFTLFHFAAGFLFNFTAYSSAQNTATTLDAASGGLIIAVVYLAFMISCLSLSPTLCSLLGPKGAILLGCICNLAFIGSAFSTLLVLRVVLAAIVGAGLATMWVGHAAYLTTIARQDAASHALPTDASLPFFNGAFWMVVQTSQIWGNAFSLVLGAESDEGGDGRYLLYSMCLTSALVAFLVLALLPAKPAPTLSPPLVDIKNALAFFISPKFALIFPLLFYSGAEAGFMFADFTKEFISKAMGAQFLGIVMPLFGAVSAISCFLVGILTQRFKYSVIGLLAYALLAQLIMVVVFLPTAFSGDLSTIQEQPWRLFVAIVVWSTADASLLTLTGVIMGAAFPAQPQAAITQIRFSQAIGYFIFFATSSFTPLTARMIGLIILGIFASGTTVIFHLRKEDLTALGPSKPSDVELLPPSEDATPAIEA